LVDLGGCLASRRYRAGGNPNSLEGAAGVGSKTETVSPKFCAPKGAHAMARVRVGSNKWWQRVPLTSNDGLSAPLSIITFQLTVTLSRQRPRVRVPSSPPFFPSTCKESAVSVMVPYGPVRPLPFPSLTPDKQHGHGARPELQVHGCGAEDVAEQDQNWSHEQRWVKLARLAGVSE